MSRGSTLFLALGQGGLAILGAYMLVVSAVFGVITFFGAISEGEFLSAFLVAVVWLAFAGLEFLLARKTVRAVKRWRQAPYA